jgi:predicted transcriptional regulator
MSLACSIKSKDLNMPRTTLVTRIEVDLKNQLGEIAKQQNRTTSNLIEWLVKQYLGQVAQPTSSTASMKFDFTSRDDLHSVLAKRRPAIADTLRYLEDK